MIPVHTNDETILRHDGSAAQDPQRPLSLNDYSWKDGASLKNVKGVYAEFVMDVQPRLSTPFTLDTLDWAGEPIGNTVNLIKRQYEVRISSSVVPLLVRM